MTQQYGRASKLVLGDGKGGGVDLSQLRVEGDTRGEPWYTNGVGKSCDLNEQQPISDAVRKSVAS